ncbi:zinc ribbon domain-containing protein [Streptomyces sp. CT34]|uniref:zinc ribbon domain-containing protein n=1 Tax=Streptomyces sp. CT34 TaxID=1553907 RepID=UPI001F52A7D3|nr:zinc ribbon domain-containing protein [Streptomyces sp. CT34]
MRWNAPEDWIISTKPAHPALVSEANFIAAQHIRAARTTAPEHIYMLAGLLRCAACDRRMESCWARRAAYRCRHGHSSARRTVPGRPANAYVREDHILPHLPALLIRLTTDGELPEPGRDELPTEADAVKHLRANGTTLTYHPEAKTLTTDAPQGERIKVTLG